MDALEIADAARVLNTAPAPSEPFYKEVNLTVSPPSMPLLLDAITYAFTAPVGQVRKGTAVPYVSHLMFVGAIVLEYGGDEELACAALLHDACAPSRDGRSL